MMSNKATSKVNARARILSLSLVEAALIGGRLAPLAAVYKIKPDKRERDLIPMRHDGVMPSESIRTRGPIVVPSPLPFLTPDVSRVPNQQREQVIGSRQRVRGGRCYDFFGPWRLVRGTAAKMPAKAIKGPGKPVTPKAKPAKLAASGTPLREDHDINWSSVRRDYPLWGLVNRSGHRHLKNVWSAFRAALAATGRNRVDLKTKSGREASRCYCEFAHWLVKTTALSGITHVLNTVKQWTSEVRRWVVEGVREQERHGGIARFFRGSLRFHVTNDDAAVQLSYVGRALPQGPLSVQRKALVNHKKALGGQHVTQRHVLLCARDFAKGWGARFLRDVPLMNCGFSQSACLEVSASKGGTLEATLERVNALQTDENWSGAAADWKKIVIASGVDIPDCDVDIVARGAALRDRSLEELRRNIAADGLPRASVAVLPERGVKARVVTKSPWALVQLSHPIRSWLLDGLKNDPRSSQVLKGDHLAAATGLVDRPRLADGRTFLSADLTAASDLIPLDLVMALVEGLIEGTEGTLPDWAIEVLRLAVGPMLVDYSQAWGRMAGQRPLPGAREIISERGILMGLPTTWTLLCILQLFWADRAWRLSFPNVVRTLPGDPAATPATVICGDDLAAWWPHQVADAYEQVVVSCGGVFSAGKHFRSRAVVVFTELLFRAVVSTVGKMGPAAGQQGPTAPAIASWEREGRPFMMKRRRPRAKSAREGRHARRGRQTLIPSLTPGIKSPHDLSVHRRVVIRLEPFSSVPLKGLIEPSGTPDAEDHHKQPRWVSVGPIAERISKISRNPLAVRRVLRTLYPTYWDWFRSHGFEPSLPRFLGGPGLPPRTGDPDRLALPRDWMFSVRRLLYGTPWHKLKCPTSPWVNMGAGEIRKDVAAHAEWKLSKSAMPARKGRKPYNGMGILLGGFNVLEDLSTRLENEAIVGVYGFRDETRRSAFKVRPGEVARAVRKFWKTIFVPVGEARRLRGEERRRGRKLNKTSIRNLEARWKEVRDLQVWHVHPKAGKEGFVLSVPRRVKSDLAIKLGQSGRQGNSDSLGEPDPSVDGGMEPAGAS